MSNSIEHQIKDSDRDFTLEETHIANKREKALIIVSNGENTDQNLNKIPTYTTILKNNLKV